MSRSEKTSRDARPAFRYIDRMPVQPASPAARQAIQNALQTASRYLQMGNPAGAEAILAPYMAPPVDPYVQNAIGVIRLAQGRPAEALGLFEQAVRREPKESQFIYGLGRALVGLGRDDEALAALNGAIKLEANYIEARFDKGLLLHRMGRLPEAEAVFRDLIRRMPTHTPSKLMLGTVLLHAGRAEDAETPIRKGLAETNDPQMKAHLHANLGLALRLQRKDRESLEHFDQAVRLNPQDPQLQLHRTESLQNLGRHDEAVAVYRAALAKNPADPSLHHGLNDLLWRLDRGGEFLQSYDTAPRTVPLRLGKAFFLIHARRPAEAHDEYAALLKADPADQTAATGVATALSLMGESVRAVEAFDALMARHGATTDLLARAAEPAMRAGDPAKAAWYCEQGLKLSPSDSNCVAMLSIASRMLEDSRDDALNRYDALVREFELEPPDGFSDMESFNHELNAALDRVHPDTREFINQSLRGGTQTPDQIFNTDIALVTRLKRRIDEAVARYIAELPEDAAHPFLTRRARDFRYAGSWSSRLKDCGFHVNHLHPMGWISSCYYVAVPEAARDETAKQGWIKFGEPSFEVPLKTPVRRAIQPTPGKLVLFPSYMWHGTVPFNDKAARTTIAFDVVPNP